MLFSQDAIITRHDNHIWLFIRVSDDGNCPKKYTVIPHTYCRQLLQHLSTGTNVPHTDAIQNQQEYLGISSTVYMLDSYSK